MNKDKRRISKKIAKVQQRKNRITWVELRIKQKKQLVRYGKFLCSRVSSAKVLPRAIIEGGEWQPQPNMCHQNITDYCEYDRSFKPARGWLFFDISVDGYCKFVAHSALQFPNGKVIDITPSNAMAEYPFIHGGLTNAEYAATVMVCKGGELNVPIQNA